MKAKIRKAEINITERTILVGDVVMDDDGNIISDNRKEEIVEELHILVLYPALKDNIEHPITINTSIIQTKASLAAIVKTEGERLFAIQQNKEELSIRADKFRNWLCGDKEELEFTL